MKIGILSFSWHGKKVAKEEVRLVKTAKKMGHKVRVIRVDDCQLLYDGKNPKVLYQGKKFLKFDIIIPRPIILTNVDLHVSIIKQFQLMKIPVVNGYMPVMRAKNKLRTMQILNHEGIAVPTTIVLKDDKYLEDAVKRVGGPPVIIKTPFGSYGAGVVLAETAMSIRSAWSFIKNNTAAGMVLLQEYIKDANGCDLRVFVIGGKVVAAMERQAQEGEFRSNIELGGKGRGLVKIDHQVKKMAIKATKVLGLQVAGVDIIISKKGPMVIEVNSNPGFKALENATGIDVAEKIIQHAVNYAKRYKARNG